MRNALQLILPKLISHRGASDDAPENTIAAFARALQMGSNWVEFDVMLSNDGVAFVIHDTTLTRTTNGNGDVGLVSSAYLQSLDAGSWFSAQYIGEPIPKLSTVIDWLNQHAMNANIEIKPYPGQEIQTAAVVIAEIVKLWSSNKILPLISSFSASAIDYVHQHAPELPIGALFGRNMSASLQRALELNAYSVHMEKSSCTSARVAQFKQAGYVVCAYTVDTVNEAKRLFNLGVDTIFSNRTDLLGLIE